MSKKTILIICNWFWPEINPRSHRASELAIELSKNHSVLVLKPNVSEDQKNYAEKFGFRIEHLGIYNTTLLKKRKGLFFRILIRVLQLFFQYPEIKLFFLVKKYIKKSTEKFDLCISIAVPYSIHWGTAAGLEKKKIANTWIADCGDPFMGDQMDSFRHPFYFEYIERWFCNKADYLSVPNQSSLNGYYKEFWHKIKVIPQGFSFDEVSISKKQHSYKCPTFGYMGAIIPNYREPYQLLDYLVGFKEDFKFIVYSDNLKYFQSYKDKLGDKLQLYDQADRLKVLFEFSSFDFVINFGNNGKSQVPSKLIDYHIIQKPILNIEFRNFDAEEFERFYNGDYSNQFKIENPDQYRIQNVANNFVNLCK